MGNVILRNRCKYLPGFKLTLSVNCFPPKDHSELGLELDPLYRNSTSYTLSTGIGLEFAG